MTVKKITIASMVMTLPKKQKLFQGKIVIINNLPYVKYKGTTYDILASYLDIVGAEIIYSSPLNNYHKELCKSSGININPNSSNIEHTRKMWLRYYNGQKVQFRKLAKEVIITKLY